MFILADDAEWAIPFLFARKTKVKLCGKSQRLIVKRYQEKKHYKVTDKIDKLFA